MTRVELEKELDKLALESVMGIFIMDTPNGYNYDGYTVNFSEAFYKENKDIIDSFAKKLCSYKREWIKCLYFLSLDLTKELLNLLKDNESIEHLTLYNFKLTKEEFDILKQNKNLKEIDSSSISEELSECYDKRIGTIMKKEITDFLTVEDIIFEENLRIYGKLTEDQVDEICNLLEKRKVKGSLNISNQVNGQHIKKIIDKFERVIGKNSISIEIENRHIFDYRAFTDEKQNSTIKVLTRTDEPTDMNIFIKTEAELRKLIKPLEEHKYELSPFEKHLWLHNIVATFREYKEVASTTDWKMSRYLNKLLFNDYMVCVGFAYLYKDLAQRLSLDSWENAACSKRNQRKLNTYTHMANLSYIEDEKYDIKGIYLSDTTYDNHGEDDLFLFNHFFLTPDKYESHIKDMYSSGYSLLTIKDKDEFLRVLKGDRESLLDFIIIINKYYPKHEIFNAHFSDNEAYYDYCFDKADELYELAQTINVEPISEEKIQRALVHIEKIKNPGITLEELEEKINQAFEIYHKLDEKIYKKEVRPKNTLQ